MPVVASVVVWCNAGYACNAPVLVVVKCALRCVVQRRLGLQCLSLCLSLCGATQATPAMHLCWLTLEVDSHDVFPFRVVAEGVGGQKAGDGGGFDAADVEVVLGPVTS